MLQIRPVSDLRNKFTEIERVVSDGSPVFLTKNGYGSMVVLSLEAYCQLTDSIEAALFQAAGRERLCTACFSGHYPTDLYQT